MFTGIVQTTGRVTRAEREGGDLRISVDAGEIDLAGHHVGDSIAVNGVCLTMTDIHARSFRADVSSETLALTTMAQIHVGDRVNLEPALTLSDALGGHLVSGHVDGIAKLVSREADGRAERFRFSCEEALAGYIAHKGSVTVDGVSLTVNGVDGVHFDVCLIPHTLEVTTLGELKAGDCVNLEVDLIARYVERLISWQNNPQ